MRKVIFYLNIFTLVTILFLAFLVFGSYYYRDFIDKPINIILKPIDYSYKSRKLNKLVSNIDNNNFGKINELFNSYKNSAFDNKQHEYAKILFFGLSDYWFKNNDFDPIIENAKFLLKINPNENRVRHVLIRGLMARDNNSDENITDLKNILDRHPYDLGFIELYFKNTTFKNYDECISDHEFYLSNVMMTNGWSYQILDHNGEMLKSELIHPDEFRESILKFNFSELESSILKINIPSYLFINIKVSNEDGNIDKNSNINISADKNSHSVVINDYEVISHGRETQYFNVTTSSKKNRNEDLFINLNFDFSLKSKIYKNNLCTQK